MLRTLNLEIGMPTAEEAIEELRYYLLYGEGKKGGVIKIIHGYGSSGKGGAIRRAVREYLEKLLQSGDISALVYGEHFTSLNRAALLLRNDAYELNELLDKYNRGVTLIKVQK